VDVEKKIQPEDGHNATSVVTGERLRSPPLPFTAATQLEGNRAVVMLRGELDMASIAVVTESLLGIAFVVEELVLDFSDLEFIDASGLRTIASTARQVKTYGGSTSVRSPNPRIERLLDLTDFKQIVEIESQALS
jgi:anti-anti-sigma factor